MQTIIRELRERRGLTQADIERLTNRQVFATRLSVIERGLTNPSVRERAALVEVFRVPADELFPPIELACPGTMGETP